ncbi:hypothetical protein [Aeoliella sp.]|uniref:hypothetical protein n=1 Tax=Aeoliella sp. TaxID=2795800 RepID=UPI003CCBBEDA
MNQLPDVHQSTLDAETLNALFRDIAAFGQDIEVVLKRHSRQQVEDASMSLADGLVALREQSALAVQIRYTHEGKRWCDTLAPASGGCRLTRINLSEASGA